MLLTKPVLVLFGLNFCLSPANQGINPFTGVQAVPSCYIRDILSVIYTCGMYNFAGEWAYKVGLPAKSGVSGGLLVVVPGRMGIGIFSPLLDERGNSVRGVKDYTECFSTVNSSAACVSGSDTNLMVIGYRLELTSF